MINSAKTVLITGCSSGIGRELSFFLREKGWLVYPTTRTEEEAGVLRKEGFDSFQLDVSSSDSLASALKSILGKTGVRHDHRTLLWMAAHNIEHLFPVLERPMRGIDEDAHVEQFLNQFATPRRQT